MPEGPPAAELGLVLDGLRCAGCVHKVEQTLRAAPGVIEAAVNYTTGRALVRFDPACIDSRGLVAEVATQGVRATPYDPSRLERPAAADARAALARLLVSAFLAGNVMVIAAALYIGAHQGIADGTRGALRWLAVALSLPAIAWCALPFWRGALAGLRGGRLTMDVPVVLGASVAFAASVAATHAGHADVYVDSAAMIVFLVLLGRTLEGRARARASSAVDGLARLQPATAWRRTGRTFEEVESECLEVGDRVRVAAGARVPADGSVLSGATEVDESLLTGESLAVLREPGDRVVGGTRNLLDEIEVEVVARVQGGTLAELAALLERAQAKRPQLQRRADRVAAVFAPAVLAVAAATAAYGIGVGRPSIEVALTAAAVLIVACPCALGLATPAAVTAALGRAASLGVMVKSGEALERCAAMDALVLDKTGTLTEGRLTLERVVTVAGTTAEVVIAEAAAAEGASIHPIARALRGAARERGLEVGEITPRTTRAGSGVAAGSGDLCRRVGTRAWLESEGVRVDAGLSAQSDEEHDTGRSLVWVSRGEQALGFVALSDPLRPDAARALERLQGLGVTPELSSGDQKGPTTLAAHRVGGIGFAAAVSPAGKVQRIEALRAAGRHVGMAGDGINDAAAMSAADVGFAFAGGADTALHAADLVVLAPRLGALPDLIELSRSALARIHENLGLALAYNAVAIPLAVSGVLGPLGAALAMSASSVVVTSNAIRLLRFRPRP